MASARNFKSDIRLDRFELEVEAERQSTIYQYWSDILANAKRDKDTASNELEQLKAEKALHYRLNSKEMKNNDGDTITLKVTEPTVAAMVDTDPDIIAKKEELAQLKYRVSKLEGRLTALDHKKRMIDNLRHLYISGYYSKPGNIDNTGDKVRPKRTKNLEEEEDEE